MVTTTNISSEQQLVIEKEKRELLARQKFARDNPEHPTAGAWADSQKTFLASLLGWGR